MFVSNVSYHFSCVNENHSLIGPLYCFIVASEIDFRNKFTDSSSTPLFRRVFLIILLLLMLDFCPEGVIDSCKVKLIILEVVQNIAQVLSWRGNHQQLLILDLENESKIFYILCSI